MLQTNRNLMFIDPNIKLVSSWEIIASLCLLGFCNSFNKQILFNLFIGPWHTSIKFEERTSTSKYKYRFTNCKLNRRWALIEFWNVNHDKKTTFISLSDFYSELTSKTSTFLKCCHPVQLNIKVNTSCLANICKERTKTFVEKKNWQEVIHVVLYANYTCKNRAMLLLNST